MLVNNYYVWVIFNIAAVVLVFLILYNNIIIQACTNREEWQRLTY